LSLSLHDVWYDFGKKLRGHFSQRIRMAEMAPSGRFSHIGSSWLKLPWYESVLRLPAKMF
jgi:hypothetical protein